MSVFKKLKGTFQHAQQDFVEGMRALTSLDSQARHDQHLSLKAREINLDAGAELLNSYQKNWSSIESNTRESAKKAEEVAAVMAPLFKVWDKHAESVTHLQEEVKTIPNVLATLTQLHTLLDSLRQGFVEAEKGLDVLEDICEEQEFKNRCFEEQKKLAMYRVKKEAEAERIKVDLAKLHAKKMADLESAKKMSLQERADAFTSAFQNDLDFYRTHGHPGRIPTEFPKVSSLSEIELDQDKQALDSFLGSGGEASGAQSSLELSGEGAYIEDDYITDYSVKQDDDFLGDIDYINDADVIQVADGDYAYPANSEFQDSLYSSNEHRDDTTAANDDDDSIHVSGPVAEVESHKVEANGSKNTEGDAIEEVGDPGTEETIQSQS